VQDLWPESLESTGYIKNRFLLSLVRAVVRVIYKFSDTILIQSEGFRKPIEQLVSDHSKIHFFPNSSDDLKNNLNSDDQNMHIANEIVQSFSIVFAGNIGTAQNCESIIEAADLIKEYSEIKFYLIGSGSMTESLQKMIAQRQLQNVLMPGRVPPESMPHIYDAASVLLLTLREDPTLSVTIPSKLQSYLAAGKPIIVGNQGEAANVLMKAKAGFHCPAGNARALADTVVKMYQLTPEERAKLGNNGRQYFLSEFQLTNRVVELSEKLKDFSSTEI
jgi:glycosyltransferase involved in cell wall biosynthesis